MIKVLCKRDLVYVWDKCSILDTLLSYMEGLVDCFWTI